MLPAVPKGLRSLASVQKEEERMGGERPGIGSILEFSNQVSEKRESLRRTFSADMSSKKWLAENLRFSLKKNSSTEEFSTITPSDSSSASSSSSGSQEEKEQARKDLERPGQFDIWSSILSQKTTSSDSQPITPYIHPLVKRSKSLLSQKSLEICTESLGSETGSDGFSSSSDCFTSDSSDNDDEEAYAVEDEMQDTKKELVAVTYNCSISRRSPTRSFPPPLPSLSRPAGLSLKMRPHRKDGRLIVEAIPSMSHSYLHAQREGGRLRLSVINSPCEEEAYPCRQQEESKSEYMEEAEEEIEVEEDVEEDEEEEEEEEVEESAEEEEEEEKLVAVLEKGTGIVTGMGAFDHQEDQEWIRVGQPILVMSKIVGGIQHPMHLRNPNPWVGQKFDGEDEQRGVSPILATASFNGYDLWWKSRPVGHPAKQGPPNKLLVSTKNPRLMFKAEGFFSVKRCNEYRRPALVREPFCIATT